MDDVCDLESMSTGRDLPCGEYDDVLVGHPWQDEGKWITITQGLSSLYMESLIPEGRSTSSWLTWFAEDTIFAVRCEEGRELVDRREEATEKTRRVIEHGMGGGK